jgi:hypothetical protein
MKAPHSGEVLQLRVTPRDVEPLVFRVIQVSASSTFHGLHRALQYAFGWKNYHLYEFQVGRRRIAAPDPERAERPRPLDPRTTRLANIVGSGTDDSHMSTILETTGSTASRSRNGSRRTQPCDIPSRPPTQQPPRAILPCSAASIVLVPGGRT